MARGSKLASKVSEEIKIILGHTKTESCSVAVNYYRPETAETEEVYQTFQSRENGALHTFDDDHGTLVYPIGSMTKAAIAVALHLMIDVYSRSEEQEHQRYKIFRYHGWKFKYVDIFNEYSVEKMEALHGNPTLMELLVHFHGLPDVNYFILGPNGRPTRSTEDFIKLAPRLSRSADRKTGEWVEYSNGNYILIGMLIEAISKIPLGQFLKKEIFDPLGMDHTFVKAEDIQGLDGSSRAFPYVIDRKGERKEAADCVNVSDCIEIAALGIYSCPRDVARLYREILGTSTATSPHQILDKKSAGTLLGYSDPENPDKREHMSRVKKKSSYDQWVPVGLVTTANDKRLGSRSINRIVLSDQSASSFRLGTSLENADLEVYYQAGSISTFSCYSYMIADTNDVVIVMCNTIGQGDPADWIARLLLQDCGVLKIRHPPLPAVLHAQVDISDKAGRGSADFFRVWQQKWATCTLLDNVTNFDSQKFPGTFRDNDYRQSMEISLDEDKLFIEIMEASEGSSSETTAAPPKRSGKIRLARSAEGKLQICPEVPQIDCFAAWKNLVLSYEIDGKTGKVSALSSKIDLGGARIEIRYIRQS